MIAKAYSLPTCLWKPYFKRNPLQKYKKGVNMKHESRKNFMAESKIAVLRHLFTLVPLSLYDL
jgi:hypothetical protein